MRIQLLAGYLLLQIGQHQSINGPHSRMLEKPQSPHFGTCTDEKKPLAQKKKIMDQLLF